MQEKAGIEEVDADYIFDAVTAAAAASGSRSSGKTTDSTDQVLAASVNSTEIDAVRAQKAIDEEKAAKAALEHEENTRRMLAEARVKELERLQRLEAERKREEQLAVEARVRAAAEEEARLTEVRAQRAAVEKAEAERLAAEMVASKINEQARLAAAAAQEKLAKEEALLAASYASQAFPQGSWVWIESEARCAEPAKVLSKFKRGETTTVMTEDGDKVALTADQTMKCMECLPEVMDSKVSDLINLPTLNENSILHNLRIRFTEDKVYTKLSSILISVNPLRLLSQYTPAVLDSYLENTNTQPHVYQTAITAYQNLLSSNANQSMIVSGESGAGKTEITKLILQCLVEMTKKHNTGQSAEQSILEKKLLAANPILEAFGNAMTVRNDNSSRFGKLVSILIDSKGSISGGEIVHYLLEKSRVTTVASKERNFRILHLLMYAVNSALPQINFNAGSLIQCDYLPPDGTWNRMDYEFEQICAAMDELKLSKHVQKNIFQILVGILHLGNIRFIEKSGKVDIRNFEAVEALALLWGCNVDALKSAFISRMSSLGTVVEYSFAEAKESRDALARRVYSELFQFVVSNINQELCVGSVKKERSIRILDIFGFECFEVSLLVNSSFSCYIL